MEQQYKIKKTLTDKIDEVNANIKDARHIKEEKTLKILNQINISISCLTQEEIAIFIKEIVVTKEDLRVIQHNSIHN